MEAFEGGLGERLANGGGGNEAEMEDVGAAEAFGVCGGGRGLILGKFRK